MRYWPRLWSDWRKVLIQRYLKNEASSKRSIALLRSSCFKEINFGTFELREFSKCGTAVTRLGFEGDAPRSRTGRWGRMRCENRVKLTWLNFAQENEALTPKNTIPCQKFAETAET
jgi:hypothetical protein